MKGDMYQGCFGSGRRHQSPSQHLRPTTKISADDTRINTNGEPKSPKKIRDDGSGGNKKFTRYRYDGGAQLKVLEQKKKRISDNDVGFNDDKRRDKDVGPMVITPKVVAVIHEAGGGKARSSQGKVIKAVSSVKEVDDVITKVESLHALADEERKEDRDSGGWGSGVDDDGESSCGSLPPPPSTDSPFATPWYAPQKKDKRKGGVVEKKEGLSLLKSPPSPPMSDVTASPARSSASESGSESSSSPRGSAASSMGSEGRRKSSRLENMRRGQLYKNWVLFDTVTGRGDDTMRRRTSVMKGDDDDKVFKDRDVNKRRTGKRRTGKQRFGGGRPRGKQAGAGRYADGNLTIIEIDSKPLLSVGVKRSADQGQQERLHKPVGQHNMQLVVAGAHGRREEVDPSFWR